MMTANRLPDANISRVYSTIVGGVIATSIIVMGNGAVAIGHNYDCPGQMVSYQNGKTNIYKSFTSGSCISLNLPGYSSNKSNISGVERVMVNEEKLGNLKKLQEIAMLQDNWNANGAEAFSPGLISKVRNIIVFLEIQPEVFPTACGSFTVRI